MRTKTVAGVELVLSEPLRKATDWVGETEVMEQVLACWLVAGAGDLPLTPRLVGRPGVGKTTLACAAGAALGRPVYIFPCTMDTRPEDLLVTPVIASDRSIAYHASPIVTAMIEGGIAVLDESNRMSEKSWASLAPLLDHRRSVESVIAGITIEAHPDFRCAVTMNDDASTYEVPDYMMSRLQPEVRVEFPGPEAERAIIAYHLPFAPDDLLDLAVNFLKESHEKGRPHSTRDGITIVRYALKRIYQGKPPGPDRFAEAVERIAPGADDDETDPDGGLGPRFRDFSEFFEDE